MHMTLILWDIGNHWRLLHKRNSWNSAVEYKLQHEQINNCSTFFMCDDCMYHTAQDVWRIKYKWSTWSSQLIYKLGRRWGMYVNMNTIVMRKCWALIWTRTWAIQCNRGSGWRRKCLCVLCFKKLKQIQTNRPLLAIREIKTIVTSQLAPVRMTIIQKSKSNMCRQGRWVRVLVYRK